ncbi:hypothetical protein AaE_005029 [Aphanomyces astaci]|uniref:FCP1 homology domain-containing protein n=1 Tax=Aphanomyces astaci TaxID=112090 RepID=A0A6A5ANI5_APHAT|nr:hypothetical protein AaE_005029 [Aphanomyces astaci]
MAETAKRDSRVIFLDVDGVLNTLHGQAQLNAVLLHRLSRLVHLTRAKLVVSSTWRLHFNQLRTLVHALGVANVPCHRILGVTGPTVKPLLYAQDSVGYCRAEEILVFVRGHPHLRWVALDDLALHLHPDMPRDCFVQTSPHRGLSLEAMRRVLALFPEASHHPIVGAITWKVSLDSCCCFITREGDKSLVLRQEQGRDWRAVHEWVHDVTGGDPFQVVFDHNFNAGHAKAAVHGNDSYAMLLLHDAIESARLHHVTTDNARALQSFDRFVLLQSRLGTNDTVTFTVVNAYTSTVERQHTWSNPTLHLTMALLRAVDEWLVQTTAGLSWILVGDDVGEWVEGCARMELPCPAYFYTWHHHVKGDVETFLVSLANGSQVAPTSSVAVDVDVTLVHQQWAVLCPSQPPQTKLESVTSLDARNLLELLPAMKSPATRTQHELMKVVALKDWTMRHLLAGYLARGDIMNGTTLDMTLAMLHDGELGCFEGTSTIDDMLW